MRHAYIILQLLLMSSLSFSQVNLSIASKSKDNNRFKLMVEGNLTDLGAHKKYLYSKGITIKELVNQYSIWMNDYPNLSSIPFSIGKYLYREDSPLAKDYLLKSVNIDPKLTEAWELLANDAQRWGDKKMETYYLMKRINYSPQNEEYILRYAQQIKKLDKRKSDSLTLAVVLRYPKSDVGARALIYLAEDEDNKESKIIYYSKLYELYHVLQPPVFRDGMNKYFSFLINIGNPEKAFKLALDMIFVVKENKLEWKHKIKVAKGFIDAQEVLLRKNYSGASEILDSIKLTDDFSNSSVDAFERLLVLKCLVWNLDQKTQSSYDSLLKYYSLLPTIGLKDEMYKYAGKLGKDSTAVQDEINFLHNKRAIPAAPFSLRSYQSDQKISLEDFKGKVVLLTFWFPGCGPCRAEFPYFESVMKKFSKDEVAYLAVNVMASEDEFVLPFLKNTKYSFISLRDDPGWDKGTLNALAFPTNYIIDPNGRIIHSKFYINKQRESTLELMIRDLINTRKAVKPFDQEL